MVSFTPEVLTILTLVSISWAGITCIGVIILLIVFICISCAKRHQSTSINPTDTTSTASSISDDNRSLSIPPLSIKTPIKKTDQYRKQDQENDNYNPQNFINEHVYSYNNKNKYQQQEYMRDNNDDTTTINESRMYGQYHQKRQYQPLKSIADVRVIDRNTPYPPDVLAREKLMDKSRFPMKNKF